MKLECHFERSRETTYTEGLIERGKLNIENSNTRIRNHK